MSANETSFKPGQTGNPKGRPHKGYSISETIREMMAEKTEIKRKLASKVIEIALKGDLAAIKTIWMAYHLLNKKSPDHKPLFPF